MIYTGGALGALIIGADIYLEKIKSEFRMPVLAVAVGLYLPLELDTSIFIGGIIAWLVNRNLKSRMQDDGVTSLKARELGEKTGMLFASGLITGEALMGIIIAIMIVVSDASTFRIFEGLPFGSYPGLILLIMIVYALYKVVMKTFDDHAKE